MKQLTITLLTLTISMVTFADSGDLMADIAGPIRANTEFKIDAPTIGLLNRLIGVMSFEEWETKMLQGNNPGTYSETDNIVRSLRWDVLDVLVEKGLNKGGSDGVLSDEARKAVLKAYSNPTTFLNACETNIPVMIDAIKKAPTPEKKINMHSNFKTIVEQEMGHMDHVLTGNPHYDTYYNRSKANPDKHNVHELSGNHDFLSYAFYKRRFDEGGKPLLDAYKSCGGKALAALQANEPPAITPVAGQWGPYHNTDYGIEYGRDGGASGE